MILNWLRPSRSKVVLVEVLKVRRNGRRKWRYEGLGGRGIWLPANNSRERVTRARAGHPKPRWENTMKGMMGDGWQDAANDRYWLRFSVKEFQTGSAAGLID